MIAVQSFCILVVAVGVLVPNTSATKFDVLLGLFKQTFGPMYVSYRKMPASPQKDAEYVKVSKFVTDNNWNKDTETNFCLATVDLATFTKADSLSSQLNIIYEVKGSLDALKGIKPLSLFKDLTDAGLTAAEKQNLPLVEPYVKEKFAALYAKGSEHADKVVFYGELVDAIDLSQDDEQVRKHYLLCLIGVSTA